MSRRSRSRSNIVFAPAYYNGPSGYGLWNWSQARAFNSWIDSSDFTHDQAFVTLQQRNGAHLIDTVGGNGLVWGNSQSRPGARIWGWPAEPPTLLSTPDSADVKTMFDQMTT